MSSMKLFLKYFKNQKPLKSKIWKVSLFFWKDVFFSKFFFWRKSYNFWYKMYDSGLKKNCLSWHVSENQTNSWENCNLIDIKLENRANQNKKPLTIENTATQHPILHQLRFCNISHVSWCCHLISFLGIRKCSTIRSCI